MIFYRKQIKRKVFMKTAKELYQDNDFDENWFCISDYNPILEEFGDILIQQDDGEYEGDSRVLYSKDGKYGYLQFGWGSCSGCDALQGCKSFEDVDNLIEGLYDSIKWFESKEDALSFFKTHDWEGDYSWNDDGQKEFIEKCINYLS